MALLLENLKQGEAVVLKQDEDILVSAKFLAECFRKSVQWIYILVQNKELFPDEDEVGPHGEMLFSLADALQDYSYYVHAVPRLRQKEAARNEELYRMRHPDEDPEEDEADPEEDAEPDDLAAMMRIIDEYTDYDSPRIDGGVNNV